MPDGTLHLSYASLSHKTIPPKWMLGDVPLEEAEGDIIARGDEAERQFFEAKRKELEATIDEKTIEQRLDELERLVLKAIGMEKPTP
jgi:hypothetical protein